MHYKVAQKLNQDHYYSSITQGMGRVEYVQDQWTVAPQWLADEGYHLLA